MILEVNWVLDRKKQEIFNIETIQLDPETNRKSEICLRQQKGTG